MNPGPTVWHGPDDVLEVGAHRISGPLVYCSSAANCGEPSAIVFAAAPKGGRPSPRARFGFAEPYYQSYAEMSGTDRDLYLKWLQDGQPVSGPSCFFEIYLRGLERRVIEDEADFLPVWHAAWHLLEQCPRENFVLFCKIGNFLLLLLAKAPDSVPCDQVRGLSRVSDSLYGRLGEGNSHPHSLLLWWCSQKFGFIPHWIAYAMAQYSIWPKNDKVIDRVHPEVEELFELLYRKRLGEGPVVKMPRKAKATLLYAPINQTVKTVRCVWPDPLVTARVSDARQTSLTLLRQCHEALRPLAAYLGRPGSRRGSAKAWEVTPPALRPALHPVQAYIRSLGPPRNGADFVVAEAGTIAAFFDVREHESLSSTKAKELATSLVRLGLGVEPDARLTGKAMAWTAPVALFNWPRGENSGVDEEISTIEEQIVQYRISAFSIKLAVVVAKSRGALDEELAKSIHARLGSQFQWTKLQETRFRALVNLCATYEIGALPSSLPTGLEDSNREQVRDFLVELAQSSGKLEGPAQAALRYALKRLGFKPAELSALFDFMSRRGIIFTGPVPTPNRRNGSTAPEKFSAEALELDRALVASLLEETRHVQATLTEAMRLETESSSERELTLVAAPLPAPTASESDEFGSLTPRFHPVLRDLLQRDKWSTHEARDLARTHGVMLSGALEAINEWAIEAFGAHLIWDEGEILTMEREIIQY